MFVLVIFHLEPVELFALSGSHAAPLLQRERQGEGAAEDGERNGGG